mgnify:CR=1 FL=1
MTDAPIMQQVFKIEGVDRDFSSKAEALDYLRRPKILAAMQVVTEGNTDLSNWLVDNQDTVVSAFDTGTIRRVTKSEKKKLDAVIDAIAEAHKGDKKFAFFTDNAEAFKESFRWPKVKRMTDEEKALAARNTLMTAADGSEDVAKWVIAHEAAILEAFNAGKEKREVSPAAQIGLLAYREGKAAEKAALDSGASPEEAKKIGQAKSDEIKANSTPKEAAAA